MLRPLQNVLQIVLCRISLAEGRILPLLVVIPLTEFVPTADQSEIIYLGLTCEVARVEELKKILYCYAVSSLPHY